MRVVNLDMSFAESKNVLRELWSELKIPHDIQMQFMNAHFREQNTKNLAAILAQINRLFICRKKLLEILSSVKIRNSLLEVKFPNLVVISKFRNVKN